MTKRVQTMRGECLLLKIQILQYMIFGMIETRDFLCESYQITKITDQRQDIDL